MSSQRISRFATLSSGVGPVWRAALVPVLGSILGLASWPAVGAAQQRISETVIVSATAEPVPFENLARTVFVITREDIARLPVHSAGEVLRYASSVEVRSRAVRGLQSDFSIRGAGFGQTLVLVDGVRINDAQSGHHNGDIPVALEEIERIEVLYGTGSSLYGADAFGGTINVITRRSGGGVRGRLQGGDFDTASGSLQLATQRGEARHGLTLFGDRSTGFMFDRGYKTYGVTARSALGSDTSVVASYLWRDFGANGAYGPAPSREWTNQTWLGVDQRLGERGGWTATASGAFRTHGDHFIWDIRDPSISENEHRTHAVTGVIQVRGALSSRTHLTVGTEVGGDWLRSTNLGDHEYARGSAFAELRHALGSRTVVYPGVRYDGYSGFGGAWSPSIAASTWVDPSLKVRGAVGRAFRVPTFTELYYHDPLHLARPDLTPERAWSVEGGVDYLPATDWLVTATLFTRRERDVIDWVRQVATDRWRTTNIRRVTTTGVELGIRRTFGDVGSLNLQYTGLTSDAGSLDLLSKYVLDYAPHSLAGSASLGLPGHWALGQRVDYRRRADERDYWLLDTRLSRDLGDVGVYVEVTNLLDTSYQEVLGVQMPGRWVQAGLTFGTP